MREFPQLFSQQDPRWGNILINNQLGCTIGLYGCYLISMEMTANYYGHLLTPPQLNNLFTQDGLFTQGDLIASDDSLSKVFPDIVFMQTIHFEDIPADLSMLKTLSDDPDVTVILELNIDVNPSDAIQTHFVCLHSYDGKTLQIYDPLDGKDKNFSDSYGNDPSKTILKYVVYKGTPGTSQINDQSNDTLPVLKTTFTELVTKSTNFDQVFHDLHITGISADDPQAGERAIEVIKNLQTSLNTLKEIQNNIQTTINANHTSNVTSPAPSTALKGIEQQPAQRDSTPVPASTQGTQAVPTPSLPVKPIVTLERQSKNLFMRILALLFA